MMKAKDEHFTEAETAKRRDEVIRRMANTSPQPKATAPRHQESRKKAGADRGADKDRARRER
jgi:hypothetical protein